MDQRSGAGILAQPPLPIFPHSWLPCRPTLASPLPWLRTLPASLSHPGAPALDSLPAKLCNPPPSRLPPAHLRARVLRLDNLKQRHDVRRAEEVRTQHAVLCAPDGTHPARQRARHGQRPERQWTLCGGELKDSWQAECAHKSRQAAWTHTSWQAESTHDSARQEGVGAWMMQRPRTALTRAWVHGKSSHTHTTNAAVRSTPQQCRNTQHALHTPTAAAIQDQGPSPSQPGRERPPGTPQARQRSSASSRCPLGPPQ
eukprot:366229-Chlamydomonas_euryale.AAC.65